MTDDAAAGDRAATPRRSSRDHRALRDRLQAWLATRLPAGASPRITGLAPTSANGMSSETLLVDATWTDRGAAHRPHRLVARLAPGAGDVPVFPRYELGQQFETMRLVGEVTDVPVPPALWWEPDPAVVGSPFFVMGRVDGRVPPDLMPYNFGDSWLSGAAPADQRRLQDATVAVLARLHALDRPARRLAFLAAATGGSTPLRRRVAATHDWYRFAVADGPRSPLVESGLAWLEDHWPAHESAPVLSWGDSRIGNVIYDGFEPAAVLDWEMAALGPRELDVAWLVYSHRMFEDLAAALGLPGMPTFLRWDDVATTYERLSGHAPRDLAWYGTYAALQYAIVFLRIGARAVRFGEADMPADADELITNREPLARMLAGAYWS